MKKMNKPKNQLFETEIPTKIVNHKTSPVKKVFTGNRYKHTATTISNQVIKRNKQTLVSEKSLLSTYEVRTSR